MDGSVKIAVIGGGTGLSTLLKGLRQKTDKLTAIVTVADDGGSTGRLRADYEMVAPGDVRNCMNALMPYTNDGIYEFLNHRFKVGELKGHTVGNIMLTALNEMTDNFAEAVSAMSSMLNISGTVLPVTNENVHLLARLDNGNIIEGESNIGEYREDGSKILNVEIDKKEAKAAPGVVRAIEEADAVVIGPGSLYTSIIPNLLISDVRNALKRTSAKKIYVCNVMTEPGETDDYSVCDHIKAIERHTYKGIIDYVIANSTSAPISVKTRYNMENAHTVKIDEENLDNDICLVKGDLVLVRDEYIRHNFSRLSRAIMQIIKSEGNEI